jgi:hypothetical protein
MSNYNYKDITGNRYGRLVVKGRAGVNKSGSITWLCKCDCGKELITSGKSLRRGETRSCGCARNEKIAAVGKRNATHGGKRTKLYAHWSAMKARCNNPANNRYELYGGRGITVCNEWANSFEAFRDWALANGYKENLTLDRKDTDGPYSPDNCRWATQKEQQNNRRDNRIITYNGISMNLQQWADKRGISRKTIQTRLSRGWSVARALGYKEEDCHEQAKRE